MRMRSGDTTPGSERRAIRRALRPRGPRVPMPDVYLSPDQLARMTEADINAAFGFTPTYRDADHDDNTAALDRAVHALIEMEMDKQEEQP